MINAKELRIGNFVHLVYPDEGHVIIEITGIVPNRVFFKGRDSGFSVHEAISPIPLTEELLLKCGLGQVGLYFVSELLGIGTLRFALKKIKDHFFIEYGGKYIRVASLHELQNIYYFITKRELKIEI